MAAALICICFFSAGMTLKLENVACNCLGRL
jgi:hypothetical protein